MSENIRPEYSKAVEPMARTLQSIDERLARIEQMLEKVLAAGGELKPARIKELMSSKDVAEFLGVTENSVRTWRMDGTRGPVWFKDRGVVRYRRSDVEAYMNEHVRRSVKIKKGKK